MLFGERARGLIAEGRGLKLVEPRGEDACGGELAGFFVEVFEFILEV